MPTIGPQGFVWLGALLFAIGLAGLLLRRSVLTMMMCIQLLLSGVGLTFAAYGRNFGATQGQVLALLILAMAGAQLAVGLAIVSRVFRARKTLAVDQLDGLREDT